MSNIEKKCIQFISEKKKWFFIIAICFLGLVIRAVGREFLSGDTRTYLIPWYDEMKSAGGLSALRYQVGDYNLLYQTIIALLTYSNYYSLVLYKMLSCMFDYLLAFSVAMLVCDLKGADWKKDDIFVYVLTAILFLPTVFLNSAYWGQCDSIYTTFVVLCVRDLLREKYSRGFIWLGLAFAFKLQAIFILPFVIYLYFEKNNFSILNFLYTLLTFWASGIMGYIYGRSLLEPFKIYMNQTTTWPKMYMNVSSFWLFFSNEFYDMLKIVAFILTAVLIGCGLYVVMAYEDKLTNHNRLLIAIWTVWTCVTFLPAMHERYTYIIDILFVAACFIDYKVLLWATCEILASIITYSNVLFTEEKITRNFGIVNVIMWVSFSAYVLWNMYKTSCKAEETKPN